MAIPRSHSQPLPLPISEPGLQSCLFVGASLATRLMYAEYFKWRGVCANAVTSAAEALAHLSVVTPAVVVIEDRLQDGRGVDLVLTLRRSARTARIPIALLSGDVFGMTPVRADRFGCDLLIPIPCLPDTLFDALSHLADVGATPRVPDVLDSWLFVREEESVRIKRRGDFELTVSGPGWKRSVHRFGSELELSMFQADCEERLMNSGFSFSGAASDPSVS
jgi:ActR/RegA family two-component response regulator